MKKDSVISINKMKQTIMDQKSKNDIIAGRRSISQMSMQELPAYSESPSKDGSVFLNLNRKYNHV